jgi:hypothetical protein
VVVFTIDLRHRDGVEWRVACDRDFHTAAFRRLACMEWRISGKIALGCLPEAAVR